MRLPSRSAPACQPQPRCCVASLAALLAALVLVPAAGAAPRAIAASFVSKGVGRADLRRRRRRRLRHRLLGRLARRHRLSADARHRRSIRRCVPTTNADGSRTYVPAGGSQEHGVPHLGHALPRDRHGLEHAQRHRRLRRVCKCAARVPLSVNGERLRWNVPRDQARQGPEGRQGALPARRHRRSRRRSAGAAPPVTCRRRRRPPPAAERAPVRVRCVATVSCMSERILVVEDEANIASFVSAYLEKAGYRVDRAVNGAEAKEKAVSAEPVADPARPQPARHGRARGLPARARDEHGADPDADRARRRRRQDRRPRGRRRRLPDEAVQPARAGRAHPLDPAPRDRAAARLEGAAHARRDLDRRRPPRARWSTASRSSSRPRSSTCSGSCSITAAWC